ncbi:amidase [Cucumibacter marinus]|uniref:amidase n=1 Tax=Cucumibacter marinus TaxID=1121252 RepID=UPI00040B2E9C|nr:amidase [Cucumibacter marinus]
MSLADLSITEAGALLQRRDISATELLDQHLDRIAERNPVLSAFVHVAGEQARLQARVADAALASGDECGPLTGIPVAIKDLIDTADMPTQYGSRLFAGHRPEHDAGCVAALRRAGAVIIGKAATYEFATVGPSFDTPFPPALNPRDPEHITGGSSSGSAAAVADGMVRLAIGTDTGGSVRSPASYCGIVGFKPAQGQIPATGVFPLSPSLDHVGTLAASVREAALGHAAMTGTGQDQSVFSGAAHGTRLGYARDWFATDPQLGPGVLDALDTAVSMLSLTGAQIAEITLPDYADFETAAAVILHGESFAIHKQRLAEHQDGMGIKTFRTLAAGAAIAPSDIDLARRTGKRLKAALDAVFETVDVIATATTLTTAPQLALFEGADAVWTPMRTIGFNLTGHPSLSVPCGFSRGLPVGMQLIARPGNEVALFALGHAFEMATDHASFRPAILEPIAADH